MGLAFLMTVMVLSAPGDLVFVEGDLREARTWPGWMKPL